MMLFRSSTFDELRISNVVKYWPHIGNFEPVHPLEVVDDTVLLWHFDEGEGLLAADEQDGILLTLEGTEWVDGVSG